MIVTDSITKLPADAAGKAVLAASHGGLYVGICAIRAQLGAVILSDAGVGREQAGIGALALLEPHGVPAATISHRSARIGDGADLLDRGIISFVNEPARARGVTAGLDARTAMARLTDLKRPLAQDIHGAEMRSQLDGFGDVPVSLLDSNSLVKPEDRGGIIVTGSHGGLLGGRPETAVTQAVFAAIYNDADIGIDGAGTSRLPALQQRGIAGATVSAWSARIGDGRSCYEDGFVSAINERAKDCGAEIGISARELVARLADAKRRSV